MAAMDDQKAFKNIKKYYKKVVDIDEMSKNSDEWDEIEKEEMRGLERCVELLKQKPEVEICLELESFFRSNEKWRQFGYETQSEIIECARKQASLPLSLSGCSSQSFGKKEKIHEQKAGQVFMKSCDETDSTSDIDEGFFCDSLEGIESYKGFLKDGKIGPNRGTFFIFYFTKNREGADKDVANYEKMAEELGFTDIRGCKDFTAEGISDKLSDYREEDHSKDDCVVCAISSHGSFDDKIVVNGSTIDLNDFVKHFSIQKCPSLEGKPKLIIVQACRGDMLEDSNATDRHREDKTGQEDLSTNYKDLILASSTIPAKKAVRNSKDGSYYVRCLLEEVKESKDREICEILTNVNSRLGHLKFTVEGQVNNTKQMACFRSNLTKNLYLNRGQPQVSTPCSQAVYQPSESEEDDEDEMYK